MSHFVSIATWLNDGKPMEANSAGRQRTCQTCNFPYTVNCVIKHMIFEFDPKRLYGYIGLERSPTELEQIISVSGTPFREHH
jgi:hypothetical protein